MYNDINVVKLSSIAMAPFIFTVMAVPVVNSYVNFTQSHGYQSVIDSHVNESNGVSFFQINGKVVASNAVIGRRSDEWDESDRLFYSDKNIAYLTEVINDIESGRSVLEEHDLIEV